MLGQQTGAHDGTGGRVQVSVVVAAAAAVADVVVVVVGAAVVAIARSTAEQFSRKHDKSARSPAGRLNVINL